MKMDGNITFKIEVIPKVLLYLRVVFVLNLVDIYLIHQPFQKRAQRHEKRDHMISR